MTETGVTGGFVRHRNRMVQESVFQDLRDTLIACRWMAGTTAHGVIDPYNPSATLAPVTTTPNQVLQLLEGYPINLIDYFPEVEDAASGATPPNTFAVDAGTPGDPEPLELGSSAEELQYVFTMAFYAVSDALALAVLNDLKDRYRGRMIRGDVVELFDYNAGGDTPVVRMDVDAFRYTMNTDQVAPHETHLYFAELTISDYIDA
jgi:hypothetical protein